jgi:hypothetical protein
MFKVVDGVVQVIESVFGNSDRKDGQVLEDVVLRISDPDKKNQFDDSHVKSVPQERGFPAAGFM